MVKFCIAQHVMTLFQRSSPELAPERSEPISSDPVGPRSDLECGSDRSVISHGRIGSRSDRRIEKIINVMS